MRARLEVITERESELEPHERAALPAWLYDEIMAGDLADANAVLAKLNARAPLDLRVNTLRGSPAQTRQKLADEGIRARPLAKVPLALRVEGTGQITGGVVFQSGRVEIQDAGAQIAAGLCQAQPGQTVLDFCAGAGGKTLALAAQMQNKGHLFVHDSDPKRLHPMAARVKRAGVSIVRQMAGNEMRLSERCQLVVSDVPCSWSGRWRRAPETKWHLTPRALMHWSPCRGKFWPKVPVSSRRAVVWLISPVRLSRVKTNTKLQNFWTCIPNLRSMKRPNSAINVG